MCNNIRIMSFLFLTTAVSSGFEDDDINPWNVQRHTNLNEKKFKRAYDSLRGDKYLDTRCQFSSLSTSL